eukprot:COSAG02_NODE_1922_length_10360_cov_38.101452_3_plen_74_part_00
MELVSAPRLALNVVYNKHTESALNTCVWSVWHHAKGHLALASALFVYALALSIYGLIGSSSPTRLHKRPSVST